MGRVSATDQNVGTVLSFSITESSLPFEIVSADLNSADIKLKKNAKIDFETKNQYKFKVYVTDGGKNNSAEVTINVEDVNEQPVISGANFEINENAPIGTPVGVVKVKDEDTWTIMSYALSDSTKDAAKLFKITPMVTCDAGYYCGQITVNTNNLNFEAEKKYIIKVTATDNGETYGLPPSLSATAAFSINVKDVNEPPEFEQDNYHFYVHENATEFTDIGIVHATDVDNGDKITYSINGSASINTFFELNEETGLIQLMAPLDYESEQEYKFKVIATDKGLLTDEVEVTISVIDVNEDPIFIESQVLKVTEWVPIGTKVGVVKSDDMDILNPDFRKHKYYVVGGDSSLFKIDSLTGEIIVKDTINDKSDKLAGYSLHILVVDYSREDSLLYADGDVFIELKQANNPPFLKPATFYVLENSLAGTFVGEVIAEDDFTSDEDLVYSMVTPSNEFEFSTTLNGQLVVKEGAVLDYETQKQYFITVRVTDGDGAYSEKEYRVVVRNENEPPELDNTEFSIAENSPAGTLVGKVTGIDSEDFPNQLKFAFDSNFVSNEFELSSSGTIRVKEGAVLDYETQQIYTLIVTVTDKEFATTTGEVTIYITNVNDLPVFGKNEFHIPENSPENTVVGYLEAHDEEDASEDLIYSLVGSSLEFEVTRDGKITVKKGAQLDYETKPEYAIKVSVKDLDGDSTIGTAKIFLDDVREPPTLADTTLHIPENIPIGSKVGVLISDNPEKDAVKFELITTTDKFKIRDNGTILTTGNIDYESQKEYKLKVVVIGDDGSLDTAIVTIVVDNIIEQPEVEITRAQDEDTIWVKPDTIYTNKKKIELEWTVNKRFQPDTLASFPDNGTYVFALCYEDASMDLPGCDTVVVKVDNSIPKVKISKSAEDTTNITGVTIVEQVAEDDTVFYVNHEDNVVHIRITDKAMDVDSTFNVSLRLDSLSNTKKALEKIKKLSEKEITLDDAEKAQTKRIAIDENTYEVTFKRLIGDDTVTVLYYTDKKGKAIKNSDGDVIMKVMNNVEINGKPAKVSYNVNGKTGEIIKNSNGGVYGFSYSYVDDFGGVVGINYSVDEKGKFAKTKVGDLGYQVTYTYKNRYGNTATKDIIVVVDKIVPVVKILSPADGLIVTTTGIDVKWTVDGEVQDTLVIQGLKKGINKIIRTYRDKAGNEASDSVTVYLKNPKELVVHVEKPVTIVDDDSVRKYYDVNPPREGQSYAVNMYNPYKGEEVETLIGGSFGKDKGSKKEPYPGMKGHLGPTLIFDALAPRCGDKTASGLCTLDDIIERDGLVSLETGGGWDRKKVTIDNYMKNYCTDDVFKDYSRYGAAKTNLYNTKLHVTIWVYTNLGGFLNKYSFVQEVNDPDFVSTVGEVNMSFEMKPNMDGNVITEDGRLLGTGAYIFSTEVKSVSELRCKLPDEERGNKRYVTEDLRKSFGYKRPITNKKK